MFGNHEKQELEAIEKLLENERLLIRIVDRLTKEKEPPPNDNVITSLRVTKISINNLNIEGEIMSVQFGKAQKVTATVTGFNAAKLAVALGFLTGLTATIDNTAVATVGTIDPANQLVPILGVSDGTANITYSGTNSAGTVVTFTDQIVISDAAPDTVITSLGVTYSAPVAQ